MKTLNKRSKTLLATAGIVIVVIVVGFVVLVPDTAGLFGGDVIHISPANPTIPLNQVIDMSINSVGKCDWSTSAMPTVAAFVAYCNPALPHCAMVDTVSNTKNVKVQASWHGQTVITARCALFTRSTTVTVGPAVPLVISPANPTIAAGSLVKLATTDASCTWSTSSPYFTLFGGQVADYVTVTGWNPGTGTVTAKCSGGTVTTNVTVQ